MNMPNINEINNFSLGWIIAIIAIFILTLAINFFIDRTSKILSKRLRRNELVWDDYLISTIKNPLKLFIWLLGGILIIKIASNHFNLNIGKEIYWIKNLGIIFCIVWFALKIVGKYENHLIKVRNPSQAGPVNPSTISISLKVLIIFIAALMLMQTFNINISGLVALGGIGGIVLGFASKDLLSNIFGATLIYFDQPFFISDWIRSPDRQIEGTVEHIGWRLTTIRTFDKRLIYVPNSIFSTLIVENPSRMVTRRFNENICLRYEDLDKIELVVNQIRTMLENNKGVDVKQGIIVNLSKFAEFAIEIYFDVFTTTKEWVEFCSIKQDILLKIRDIIAQNKAGIAVLDPYCKPSK